MKKRKNATIYKLDAGTEEQVKLAYIEYDEAGNRTLENHFAEDGKTVHTQMTREFNEKDRMTLFIETVGGNEQSKIETTWNEEGYRLKEKLTIEQDHVEHHKVYNWNDNYTKLKLVYKNEDGEIIHVEAQEFNEKGKPIVEMVLDENDEVIESYKYYYENGRLRKKIAHFNGFDTTYNYEYELDDQGKIIYYSITDDDGEEESEEMEYHENGKKKKVTVVQVSGAYETTFFDEQERQFKVNKYDATEFLLNETSSFYKDETHEFVTERNIRQDNQVMKLTYQYEFFE